MLSAMNKSNQQVVAWETAKEDGPFACPECHREVLVKKGDAVVHHFAHVSQTNCKYGSGESPVHWRAKLQIYESLRKFPNVSKLMVERYLKEVRPDVSFRLRGKYVAIEIQRSTLSRSKIIQRSKFYTDKKIHVLWMPLYAEKMSFYFEEMQGNIEERRYFPSDWENHLHDMYYDTVYYWLQGVTIRLIHFNECIVGKAYRRRYDYRIGEWKDGYPSKRYRTPSFVEDVNITDLDAVMRAPWTSGSLSMPATRLWCRRP